MWIDTILNKYFLKDCGKIGSKLVYIKLYVCIYLYFIFKLSLKEIMGTLSIFASSEFLDI